LYGFGYFSIVDVDELESYIAQRETRLRQVQENWQWLLLKSKRLSWLP
jgi:hypothetical protein